MNDSQLFGLTTHFAAEILMMSMKNFRIHLFCVFYSVTFYCVCIVFVLLFMYTDVLSLKFLNL